MRVCKEHYDEICKLLGVDELEVYTGSLMEKLGCEICGEPAYTSIVSPSNIEEYKKLKQPKPQVIITFTAEQSAAFSIKLIGGIIPAQLLAVSQTLEFEAKSLMNTYKMQQEYIKAQEEQAKQQIVTPNKSTIAVPKLDFHDRNISP